MELYRLTLLTEDRFSDLIGVYDNEDSLMQGFEEFLMGVRIINDSYCKDNIGEDLVLFHEYFKKLKNDSSIILEDDEYILDKITLNKNII